MIASYFPVVVTLGVAMADRIRSEIDEADEIIARSVADLQLAGVSDSAIAAALLAQGWPHRRRDRLRVRKMHPAPVRPKRPAGL